MSLTLGAKWERMIIFPGCQSRSASRARLRLAVSLLSCRPLQIGSGAADLLIVGGPPNAPRRVAVDRAARGPMELEITGGRLPIRVEHETIRIPCNPVHLAGVVIDESLHVQIVPPAGGRPALDPGRPLRHRVHRPRLLLVTGRSFSRGMQMPVFASRSRLVGEPAVLQRLGNALLH